MKKIMFRGGLILGVVAVLAFVGTRLPGSGDGGLPALHTVTVERGTVSQAVVAQGTLEPVRTVTVGSQVSGMLDDVLVDFNSPVEEGQVLARIDPSTFEAAVRSAEAELEAAEASLELARLQWERIRTLRENRVVSAAEVDEATANLRQAEAQLTVRRHALDRAQRELDRCTIHSPTDGIVITRNVDVGQTVAASLSAPELFQIATDLSSMRIHAMVSEADIGTVSAGQAVRFVVDAHRDRTFEGEVAQVRNAPLIESNVVHYETIIEVDNDEGLLKPGMTAEVEIVTAEVTDVVRVRNTALRARLPGAILPAGAESGPVTTDGRRRVWALRGGELVAVEVRTGLADDLYTEVLEGLQPGDTLAVSLSLEATGDEERRSFFQGEQAQY